MRGLVNGYTWGCKVGTSRLDVESWVSSDRCACLITARPQVKFASFAQNDLVTLFDRANPMLLPVCARNDRYAARAGDRQIDEICLGLEEERLPKRIDNRPRRTTKGQLGSRAAGCE